MLKTVVLLQALYGSLNEFACLIFQFVKDDNLVDTLAEATNTSRDGVQSLVNRIINNDVSGMCRVLINSMPVNMIC